MGKKVFFESFTPLFQGSDFISFPSKWLCLSAEHRQPTQACWIQSAIQRLYEKHETNAGVFFFEKHIGGYILTCVIVCKMSEGSE